MFETIYSFLTWIKNLGKLSHQASDHISKYTEVDQLFAYG